jgi:hypothetical protein
MQAVFRWHEERKRKLIHQYNKSISTRVNSYFGVRHALAWAKNILWTCPHRSVCRFFAGYSTCMTGRVSVPAGVLNLHDRGGQYSYGGTHRTWLGVIVPMGYSICMIGVIVPTGVLKLHDLGWYSCKNDLRRISSLGSHQCNKDLRDVVGVRNTLGMSVYSREYTS